MFLKRFAYVNWGNIPGVEFEFGPINLFSGGNGSGKTTAADAIQTVMTAAHESLFHYNPGQDETTQRGSGGKRVRTLASYVLGCDDGSYARLEATDGYLAAVFHPTEGEPGEPFTAVIAVRAWLDRAGNTRVARQDDAQFFILPGEQLALAHFVREDAAGKYVVPLTDLHKLLIAEFGKQRVEKYETKKTYLRRLYAVLRGKPDAVPEAEAIAAARAFSRFMAYKPVKSIDRLVADEILEKKDLGEAVRSISSQLKTIHNMERDAGQLVESIAILERAKSHAQNYIEQWIELNVLDYSLAQAEYQRRQSDYLRGKQLQAEQQQQQKEREQTIVDLEQRGEQINEQLISLEAQRRGIDDLKQKDALEKQRQHHDKELVNQARVLLEQDQLMAANIQVSREIAQGLADAALSKELPELADLQTEALARQVVASDSQLIKDINKLVQRDFAGQLTALEAELENLRALQQTHSQWLLHWHRAGADGQESLRTRLSTTVHGQRARHQVLADQRNQKQQEIGKLNANQVSYPGYVERALKAIRQQCPAADPRVLCDHIEVTEHRWQAALEGYIGGARFSILVEPEYESEAIRVVREMPGRDNRARVIQGEKALRDAARVDLPANSVIHALDFSHAVARAYLVASYGSVVRVDSADELRRTRRGITEQGMGSGSYSMWRCDLPDAELVFGAAARERAVVAKQQELEQLEQQWHGAGDRLNKLAGLLKAVDRLQGSSYADVVASICASQREIQKLEGLIEQLDLSKHKDLEQRLETLKAEQKAVSEQESQCHQQVGEIRKELNGIEKQLKALSGLQEQNRERVEDREAQLEKITAVWPELNVTARLDAADQEARTLNVEHASNYRQELERGLHSAERKTAENIQQHNLRCRPADAISYAPFQGEYDAALFKAICSLQRDVDRVFSVLKNNILVEKHQQLAELKQAFNSAFVSHLCHAIYHALTEGKRQIELLNKELQHHRFGADRETFRFDSEWIPEYRDYARFFEEVVKNPVLGDEVALFDAELTKKSRQVLEQLMGMLLDEDEVKAMRELERIADYRNYRRYEIYKEVAGKEPIPLSEYGTGSGGQLETPAYIVRSAAITSAFRFAEGNVHLRMVLVDEAFSKMDEIRSREVIKYLTESLGLQVVFIMPTSKCGPYMDMISNEFVFAKVPSEVPRGELQTRVLVDRKQCNQERIRELWKDHRRTVRHQAELDFMGEFVGGSGVGFAPTKG